MLNRQSMKKNSFRSGGGVCGELGIHDYENYCLKTLVVLGSHLLLLLEVLGLGEQLAEEFTS